MLTIELSNNTKLTVNLELRAKALVIKQEATGPQTLEHPQIVPPSQLVIPLADVKKLASSLKTLTGFFL
jgi:hypothetical protein